jgi:hypothetical protein
VTTIRTFISLTLLLLTFLGCNKSSNTVNIQDTYPWCIVAYDSLERTPEERIKMMKDLGFTKYAYDWRDKHLKDSKNELALIQINGIEILSVWIWLNPKRDSIHKLSQANEKMFSIVEELNLKTTFWVGLSESYFKNLNDKESINLATNLIKSVSEKANSIGCKVALYNHKGWFGDPLNQIKIIKELPEQDLSIVYNFHHGHKDIDNFTELVPKILPYLSAVNLNGMEKDGEKILPIGEGDFEKNMLKTLKNLGFKGPWGILGHVGEKDVNEVLLKNIEGLKQIQN